MKTCKHLRPALLKACCRLAALLLWLPLPAQVAFVTPRDSIHTPEQIRLYQQNGTTFPVTGVVKAPNGRPIAGAVISIQGTGRKTFSDQQGLFHIEADYSHPVIIRKNGRENRSLGLEAFMEHPEKPLTVYLYPKNDSGLYNTAGQMPEYPGGRKELHTFLDMQLAAHHQDIRQEGVVIVQFIVEKDGHLVRPTIARHLTAELDSLALQFVRAMPPWIPAKENQQPIRCKYSVAIPFKNPPEDNK